MKIFSFLKIRQSAADKSMVVLQGFFAEDIDLQEDFVVGLAQKGEKSKALRHKAVLSEVPANIRNKLGGANYRFMLSVEVHKSDLDDNSKTLFMGLKKSHKIFYRCTCEKLNKNTKLELNYNIDEMYCDDKNAYIKGWAVDGDEPQFEILDSKMNPVEMELNRQARADLYIQFPECKMDMKSCFYIKFAKSQDAKLKIFNSTYEISMDVSETAILNRLKENPVRKFTRKVSEVGLEETMKRVNRKIRIALASNNEYDKWIRKHTVTKAELKTQRLASKKFKYQPKFSILVPLYETKEEFLYDLVKTIQEQSYENWEICFSDGSRDTSRLTQIVGELSKEDPRIRYIGEAMGPLGISANTNQALSIASGDYIVLGDHDDLFERDALYECARALNENPEVDVLYTDEDKMDSDTGKFYQPAIKPDFDSFMLESGNYICHMFVVKKSLVDQIGGENDAYDGAQDFDFILRCTENAKKTYHIPKVVYHWRVHSESTAKSPEAKLYAYTSGKAALEAHYKRQGIPAEVSIVEDHLGYYATRFLANAGQTVSVIIHVTDADRALVTIKSLVTYTKDFDGKIEFVLTGTSQKLSELVNNTKKLEKENVTFAWVKGAESKVKLLNLAVKKAKGENLFFLDEGLEAYKDGTIESLLGLLGRKEVGMASAKILTSRNTFIHPGQVIGMEEKETHRFMGLGGYEDEYSNYRSYQMMASGCFMIRKEVFEEQGGFDEEYKNVAYDKDLSMGLSDKALYNVYDAYCAFYLANRDRYVKKDAADEKRFEDKWKTVLSKGDQFYQNK